MYDVHFSDVLHLSTLSHSSTTCFIVPVSLLDLMRFFTFTSSQYLLYCSKFLRLAFNLFLSLSLSQVFRSSYPSYTFKPSILHILLLFVSSRHNSRYFYIFHLSWYILLQPKLNFINIRLPSLRILTSFYPACILVFSLSLSQLFVALSRFFYRLRMPLKLFKNVGRLADERV